MQIKKTNHNRWILLVYILLFAISIPWYLPKGKIPQIWYGLPDWVVISLSATFAIATFTAFVIRYYWDETESGDEAHKI